MPAAMISTKCRLFGAFSSSSSVQTKHAWKISRNNIIIKNSYAAFYVFIYFYLILHA